jgi:dihydroflavonol-4-reductase
MVAVTGANGLLGSFIVRKLIEKQVPFVAFKRKDSDTTLLSDVASHITWRTADMLDPVQLDEALEGVTKVIHTAGVVSFNPRRATYVMDNNVIGTRNLINECLSKKIARLVHISSVAALGRQKNQTLIDEKNQWIDNPMNTVYAKSKYLAELEIFRAQEEGLNSVIVNPSVILAPADWTKSSAKLFRYVWDEKPFYTDAYLNYVDVRDVAGITVRLLDEKVSGHRLILNAGKISFYNFFEQVATRFNRRPPGIRLGSRFLRLVARFEELRARISGSEPVLTRETARLSGTEFLYSNKKIKELLLVEFQPIEASLDWCCQYYLTKNQGKK